MSDSMYEEFKERLNSIRRKRKRSALAQLVMWGLAGIFMMTILVRGFYGLFSTSSYQASSLQQGIKFLGYSWTPVMLLIPFVLLVGLCGYVFMQLFERFKKEEESTIDALVKRLFPNFSFLWSHYLPRQEMLRSNIFASFNPNDARSSYQLYGYMKSGTEEQAFHVADIGLREDNSSNKFQKLVFALPFLNMLMVMYEFVLKNLFSSRSADNIYFSFRGLFCWTDFHKPLKGHTIILPDKLEARLGEFAKTIQALNFRRDELVKLEDSRFEQQFVVYSTDQIEARYILSASFMEKLSALRQKFDRPLIVSFCEGKIYLAIEEPKGVFAFNPKSLKSFRAIEEMKELVELTHEVVEELSLNRKIVSSQ